MKDLTVATWNLKDGIFKMSKDNLKVDTITSFMKEYDVDVLALQNVERRLGLKLNSELKKMGYHFDHINEEGYTMLDRMIGYEKNPVILKDNFFNISDVASLNGLLINKILITDENNLTDKFSLVNVSFTDIKNRDKIILLSDFLEKDDYKLVEDSPVMLMGNIKFDEYKSNIEMFNLKRYALNKNDMHIANMIDYSGDCECIIVDDTTKVYESKMPLGYKLKNMQRPIYAKVKIK